MPDLTGGCVVLDKNGAIFPRYGINILKFSSFCVWDGKLVAAVAVDGTAYPNLVYFDKSVVTEVGKVGTGGSVVPISSKWRSKMYSYDTKARLKRFEYYYYDALSYTKGTNSGFDISYRIDSVVDENNIPSFTLLKSINTPDVLTDKNKYLYDSFDPELELEGKTWQFQIESDYDFRLIWFKPWLIPQPLEQI